MSQNLAEKLALEVAEKVMRSGVQRTILDALLDNIKGNVHEAMLKALLLYSGNVAMERDKEWVKGLSGLWTARQEQPSNPAEVERLIRAEQALAVRAVRAEASDSGLHRGWEAGLAEGLKFGWAGCDAGKGLQETLEGGSKLRLR